MFCYFYSMIEEWREIKDFEGLYQVSNFGRVRSLGNKTHSGIHFMKNYTNSLGYVVVTLSKNGKSKPYRLHRLVAEAFLPNPENLYQVNHIDENKENNRVDNLEWCTQEYNNNYGTRNERSAKANTNGKKSKPVLQFTKSGEFIREWPSVGECERNGYNQGAVSSCCRGEKPHYKGFLWMYK